MNKNLILTIVMGAVFFMLALQAFQLQGINAKIDAKLTGGSITSSLGGSNIQQGETYEQMMARMHPDQVKKQSAAPKGLENIPSMVGGC